MIDCGITEHTELGFFDPQRSPSPAPGLAQTLHPVPQRVVPMLLELWQLGFQTKIFIFLH